MNFHLYIYDGSDKADWITLDNVAMIFILHWVCWHHPLQTIESVAIQSSTHTRAFIITIFLSLKCFLHKMLYSSHFSSCTNCYWLAMRMFNHKCLSCVFIYIKMFLQWPSFSLKCHISFSTVVAASLQGVPGTLLQPASHLAPDQRVSATVTFFFVQHYF